MKILSVTSYQSNYQTQNQNNKKQNVNFGLFKGDAVLFERLNKPHNHEKNIFTPLEKIITEFLSKHECNGYFRSNNRKLSPEQIKKFQQLAAKAEEQNIQASEAEKIDLDFFIKLGDIETYPTDGIISDIDNGIDTAFEITTKNSRKLIKKSTASGRKISRSQQNIEKEQKQIEDIRKNDKKAVAKFCEPGKINWSFLGKPLK